MPPKGYRKELCPRGHPAPGYALTVTLPVTGFSATTAIRPLGTTASAPTKRR